MEINLYDEYGNITLDPEPILLALKTAFEEEMNVQGEVSLIVVNLERIQELNNEFRNKNIPTDVLSFVDTDEEDYLGDIFICYERVLSQAEDYGHSIEREFAFLLCHGILHLLDYDHMEPEEEKEMIAQQELILNKTKYRRN